MIQERKPMARTPSKSSPVFKPQGRGASRAMLRERGVKGKTADAQRNRRGVFRLWITGLK
jgi:hypothetical protein